MENKEKFTLVLRDPLSNSYIQKVVGDEDDKLRVVVGPRTEKEIEYLGLCEDNNIDCNDLLGNPTFNSVMRAFSQQNESEKEPENK